MFFFILHIYVQFFPIYGPLHRKQRWFCNSEVYYYCFISTLWGGHTVGCGHECAPFTMVTNAKRGQETFLVHVCRSDASNAVRCERTERQAFLAKELQTFQQSGLRTMMIVFRTYIFKEIIWVRALVQVWFSRCYPAARRSYGTPSENSSWRTVTSPTTLW